MLIEQIDPIYCQADKMATYMLKPLLVYTKEFWKKEIYKNVRREYTAFMIDENGMFLAGLLPKVKEYLHGKDIKYKRILTYNINGTPSLPGITLREDQIDLIKKALTHGRGIIKAPTAIGKTIVACGFISSFNNLHNSDCNALELHNNLKILFLCHTITLVNQTMDEFKKYLPKFSISQIGDGKKDLSGRIVISTIQSFSRMDMQEYCDLFDIVIIDETHHCNGGQYERVLTNLLAPIRIGLTATLPTSTEKKLKLEGLLGPVIGELTMEEGKQKNLLVKAKVKLINVPRCPSIKDLKQYQTTINKKTKEIRKGIYDAGICDYRTRNKMIIQEIKAQNMLGKSTLTYVTKIDHGERILSMAESAGIKIIMVQGSTEGDDRNQLRKDLHDKHIMNVVATTVWTEGVNIPSLDTIILASGGKSELRLLQTIGRGLRKHIGKEELLIIDFVDHGKYLSEHFCERLSVYLENGWI